MLYQIVKETGWSWHYVLWKISRANILLMVADQSNVKSVAEGEEEPIKASGSALASKYKQKQQSN